MGLFRKRNAAQANSADFSASGTKAYGTSSGTANDVPYVAEKDASAEAFFVKGELAYKTKDYSKAAEYYKKAAELGHAQSMCYLAYSYRFGEGVEENADTALYWYQKAYQNGKPNAAGNIGNMYHYEEISGADNKTIISLLTEGARNGNDSTYISLAEHYYLSKYNCQNSKLAAYWAYRAYQSEYMYGSFYMGVFYYNGFFFPEVPAYAKYYFENFIRLGGDPSEVSEMLEDEDLKKVNAVKPSHKLFAGPLPNNFFECDDPEIQAQKGCALLNGFDFDGNQAEQDIERGIALLKEAAEQGYAAAQSYLGLCYRKTDKPCPSFFDDGSLDVYKSDTTQYLYWLIKAADNGETEAIDTLISYFRNGTNDIEKSSTLADIYNDMRLKITGAAYENRCDEESSFTDNDATVDDIRNVKGNSSDASEKLHHIDMTKIPSWDSAKSGEYGEKVKKEKEETEARRQYIRETVRRMRNPDKNASPYERNIENACMMLAPFMTEAENLFLKREEEKALEIIEEILDINIVPNDEWYYNNEIKYFTQFLSGALYSLANQIDFDTPDCDRFIVPAANIACYIWKKYGDYSLFGGVIFLWTEAGKDQYGNFLWLKRMSDNGDYTVVSKYNESSEYYFGHDLDRYTMGSDCELF